MSDGQAPAGYHEGFVIVTVASVGLSLGYLRFVAFDPASGPWTVLGG